MNHVPTTKVCQTCRTEKSLEEFHIKADCRLGVAPHCGECANACRRSRVKVLMQTNPQKVLSLQRAYGKTLDGKIMMSYHNMRGRVLGLQEKKAHLYKGLPIMSRHEFYTWALTDIGLKRVFTAWVVSGYERRLSPSVNRIDPKLGYVAGNIEWITHGENSRLGATGPRT